MERAEKNRTVGSTLYLVATPIGNLSDISDRAKKVLSEVDFIAAEDTRNTARLLCALGIRGELVSYHEHNKHESGEKIVARLAMGDSCALVTDAGMPAISDPGEDLVKLCYKNGISVTVIPGACAAVTALALSGFSTKRFAFEGFLPVAAGERTKRLLAVKDDTRTLIFYEAPHKLCKTLDAMASAFGDMRKISLCRELTKLNEEAKEYTIAEAIEYYAKNEPRGEYVIIVEGASESEADNSMASLPPMEHVKFYEDSGLSRMDAIKKAARERGISKSEMYKLLLD